MDNIIKFEKYEKTLNEINFKNEVEDTEKYKEIYHNIHNIIALINTISVTSKTLYYEDYKNKNDMYIMLLSMLKIMGNLMEDCEFKIHELFFNIDNPTYEKISKQAETWMKMMKSQKNVNYNIPLQFKIRSTRGEEVTI